MSDKSKKTFFFFFNPIYNSKKEYIGNNIT